MILKPQKQDRVLYLYEDSDKLESRSQSKSGSWSNSWSDSKTTQIRWKIWKARLRGMVKV